jgi:signal transduction histidine kinase
VRYSILDPAHGRIPKMPYVLKSTSRASVGMIRDSINIEFLASVNSALRRERREVGATLESTLHALQRQQELLVQHLAYSLPSESAYVFLDADKMHQILINLIGNALKLTPDEGHFAVYIEAGPGLVGIRVVDEGSGIQEAFQSHLFEYFTPAWRPGLRGG